MFLGDNLICRGGCGTRPSWKPGALGVVYAEEFLYDVRAAGLFQHGISVG